MRRGWRPKGYILGLDWGLDSQAVRVLDYESHKWIWWVRKVHEA
jgi:hypothetical protein